MKLKVHSFAPFLLLILLGCSSPPQKQSGNIPETFRVPSDFSLKYQHWYATIHGTLENSTYTVAAGGKVAVTDVYVQEIKTEERQLTPQQVEALAKRAGDPGLLEVIRQAETLRSRCHNLGTDQPTGQLEFQWEGQRVEVEDDFDPQRCEEVRVLTDFTHDLPQLLEGSVTKAETRKRPLPR